MRRLVNVVLIAFKLICINSIAFYMFCIFWKIGYDLLFHILLLTSHFKDPSTCFMTLCADFNLASCSVDVLLGLW